MRLAERRTVLASGVTVLVALVLGSAVSMAADEVSTTIDPATRAQWMEDHFSIEHAAELAQGEMIDSLTQAQWLGDHFRIEHAAELAEA